MRKSAAIIAVAFAIVWAWQPLPAFPGVVQTIVTWEHSPSFRPKFLSADGLTVSGGEVNGDQMTPFRWTAAGGLQHLGLLDPNQEVMEINGMSADGKTLTGYDKHGPSHSYIWRDGVGYTDLLVPGGDPSNDVRAWGISGDGSTVVGQSYDLGGGFRWTEAGGFALLPGSPTSVNSQEWFVNHDGSIVVDAANGSIWHGDTRSAIPAPGRVHAMSDDGLVLAGVNGGNAYHWSAGSGVTTIGAGLAPLAVTPDGSQVLGNDWIWDATNGKRDLATIFASDHIDLSSWIDGFQAVDFSADGRTFLVQASGVDAAGDFLGGALLVTLSGEPAAVVPEPATWGMWLVMGGVAAVWFRRKR